MAPPEPSLLDTIDLEEDPNAEFDYNSALLNGGAPPMMSVGDGTPANILQQMMQEGQAEAGGLRTKANDIRQQLLGNQGETEDQKVAYALLALAPILGGLALKGKKGLGMGGAAAAVGANALNTSITTERKEDRDVQKELAKTYETEALRAESNANIAGRQAAQTAATNERAKLNRDAIQGRVDESPERMEKTTKLRLNAEAKIKQEQIRSKLPQIVEVLPGVELPTYDGFDRDLRKAVAKRGEASSALREYVKAHKAGDVAGEQQWYNKLFTIVNEFGMTLTPGEAGRVTGILPDPSLTTNYQELKQKLINNYAGGDFNKLAANTEKMLDNTLKQKLFASGLYLPNMKYEAKEIQDWGIPADLKTGVAFRQGMGAGVRMNQQGASGDGAGKKVVSEALFNDVMAKNPGKTEAQVKKMLIDKDYMLGF